MGDRGRDGKKKCRMDGNIKINSINAVTTARNEIQNQTDAVIK